MQLDRALGDQSATAALAADTPDTVAPSAGASADRVPLALYVHLPWCVRKCPYCDFNSHQLKLAQPDDGYVDALIQDFEAESRAIANRSIETIFFGGGTPSLFQPEAFARFLRAVRARVVVAQGAEITLEANPGTIERGRFQGYREAGITRISLGAQTFDRLALGKLGRIHSAEDTVNAVREMRAAGFSNFNVDLMYALPNQTVAGALADVRMACSLEPTHISHYQLTLEPGTAFHTRPPSLPNEDLAWEIQCECQSLLAREGYAQYEVSAYARTGFRCRHNLNYWLFGDYVGVGAGAHGKLSVSLPAGIVRTVKPKLPSDYLRQVRRSTGPMGERNPVNPANALVFEFMLNALRLTDGFSGDVFEHRTGLPVGAFDAPMRSAERKSLVERSSVGWRPTQLGRRFLNDLQASFLD